MDQAGLWTTKDIITTVIATGVVSAFFTTVLSGIASAIASAKKSRRERQYLSSRIAVALESYAAQCSSLASDISSEHERFGEVSSKAMPLPPEFPTDADWRTIKVKVAYMVLTFANEIGQQQRDATHARIFEDNPFQLQSSAIDSGTRALDIAAQVRKSINLHLDKGHEEVLDRMFRR